MEGNACQYVFHYCHSNVVYAGCGLCASFYISVCLLFKNGLYLESSLVCNVLRIFMYSPMFTVACSIANVAKMLTFVLLHV